MMYICILAMGGLFWNLYIFYSRHKMSVSTIDIATQSPTPSKVHVSPSLEQGVIVVRYLKFEKFMYVSFMFMTVLWFHPIEKCPPQSVEHSGTLATSHEGGVIIVCVLTPPMVETYACLVSFLVLYYNWNNLIWICLKVYICLITWRLMCRLSRQGAFIVWILGRPLHAQGRGSSNF